MKPANGIAGRVGIARGVMECGCVPRGAGSAAARRAPSRVEYFRHGHSCEAAAAGLRHSRGPGAFVRAMVLKSSRLMRACESAVAAGALPAQSMTRMGLPGASELRRASWTEVLSQGMAAVCRYGPRHPPSSIFHPRFYPPDRHFRVDLQPALDKHAALYELTHQSNRRGHRGRPRHRPRHRP